MVLEENMVELEVQNFEKNKTLYEEKRKELEKKLGGVAINHVGSTAIPNMCGKNIIDILIGAKDKEEFEKLKQLIIDEGYFASQNSKTEIYQFFASRQGETSAGDTHIHLVIMGTDRYDDFLTLRDYLLENVQEARDYANCKLELIKNGITDRKEYRATKSLYVSNLIERARKNLGKAIKK